MKRPTPLPSFGRTVRSPLDWWRSLDGADQWDYAIAALCLLVAALIERGAI